MLGVHILRLDDVGCKHLTSGDVRREKKSICKRHNIFYIFILYNVRIE